MGTIVTANNIVIMVHSREHGHPHVTAYSPRRKGYEKTAKVRIDNQQIIENKGYLPYELKLICALVLQYQHECLEEWNELVESQKE